MCDVARIVTTLTLGIFVLYGPIWPDSARSLHRTATHPAVPIGSQSAAASHPDRVPPDSLPWAPFAEVLEEHDAALPQFAAWRRTFAAHADDLARLVTSLPAARHLDRGAVRARLRSRTGFGDALDAGIFAPWTSAWVGTWSDGSAQYHVWDETRRWRDQHVQLVTQSEVALPDASRLDALLKHDEVDLAINVVSERAGITGWVAKRQHERLTMPCLGYLLAPATLLWLCHTSPSDTPLFAAPSWFAYLEGVDASVSPVAYHIQGQPFKVTDTMTWDPVEQMHHRGRYTAPHTTMTALSL